MKIGPVAIGPEQPVCVVAEMSCNHNGDLAKAKELIDAAKWAGADLVKMQIYTADEMCLPGVKCPGPSPWEGQDLHELYRRAGTPWEWWPILRDYAAQVGIPLFSSAFSPEAVEYLVREGCPAIKIASHEANCARSMAEALGPSRVPLIVSSCTRDDVTGPADILLWCPAGYPAGVLHAADLGFIQGTMDFYDGGAPQCWGLSDNAGRAASAVLAAQEGASMVEAHIMLGTCLDAVFSMLPAGFAAYVRAIRDTPRRQPSPPSPYRRSAWITRPVRKGEDVLGACLGTSSPVRMLRPAGPIDSLYGWGNRGIRGVAARDLEPGPLRWEDVE